MLKQVTKRYLLAMNVSLNLQNYKLIRWYSSHKNINPAQQYICQLVILYLRGTPLAKPCKSATLQCSLLPPEPDYIYNQHTAKKHLPFFKKLNYHYFGDRNILLTQSEYKWLVVFVSKLIFNASCKLKPTPTHIVN